MRKKCLSLLLALVMCLGLMIPAASAKNLEDATEADILNNFTILRDDSAFPDESMDETKSIYLADTTASIVNLGGMVSEVSYSYISIFDSWTITNTGNQAMSVSGNTDYEVVVYLKEYFLDDELDVPGGRFQALDISSYWGDKGKFIYGALEGNDQIGHIVSLKAGESTKISAMAIASSLVLRKDVIYELEIACCYIGNTADISYSDFEDVCYYSFYFMEGSENKRDIALEILKNGTSTPTTPAQPEQPAVSFTDVPAGRYFTEPVAWAVEQGITDGAGNNQFLPGRTCTNGEIITFLWRAAGELKASQAAPITAKYAGFADAINWAYEQGIIDSSFQETADCTRANTVTYIWKAKSSPAASGSNDFTDVPADADYAQAVNWAVGTKVTDGTGDGSTFSPANTCTRGEIVTFLYRAFAD